jgi:hypothetical protein
MEPQAIVAVLALGLVGVMLLISKVLTRLWVYILLLSPSWSITLFNIFDAVSKGETFNNILLNHCLGLLFVLSPLDAYLIPDPSLQLYGLVLLGIWAYLILTASIHLLGGWGLPVAPLIWWLLGKGMPNTMALIGGTLPSWLGWLTALSGLPLILLICIILGLITVFIKRRKRYG